MRKKVTLEKPVAVVFSIIIFSFVTVCLLALQNVFNGEMEILYADLGKNLTNIKQSYVVSIIFFVSLIILLIMSHLDRLDIFDELAFFIIIYFAVIVVLTATMIWGTAVTENGYKELTNNNAKLCITLPNSLFIIGGLFILYLGLFNKFFSEERMNPFIVYLLFPSLVVIIGFISTFLLHLIPNGTVLGIIKYSISIIAFGVGGFFILFHSGIGEELGVGDSSSYEYSSNDGGGYTPSYNGGSKISDDEYRRAVESNLRDALVNSYNYNSKYSISGLNVEIYSGVCHITAHVNVDLTNYSDMSEYAADEEASNIAVGVRQTYRSIASDYLEDCPGLGVSSIEVDVSYSVKYNSY